MTTRHRDLRLRLALFATVTSLFGLSWFPGSAYAIIGRPLTPVSYAGVARRTTRRAVYAGAAVGVAPVVVAPAPVVVAAPPPPVVVAPAPAYVW
jgi:hypothetical protein